jgi:hypothetical protein
VVVAAVVVVDVVVTATVVVVAVVVVAVVLVAVVVVVMVVLVSFHGRLMMHGTVGIHIPLALSSAYNSFSMNAITGGLGPFR